jgi:hypothetical protein
LFFKFFFLGLISYLNIIFPFLYFFLYKKEMFGKPFNW